MRWIQFAIIFPAIALVSTQNVDNVQQSRVLYNYPNNKDFAPTFSPLLKSPFSDFLASILGKLKPTTTTPLPPPRNCQPCTCGLINVNRRIVGGQATLKYEYPWMVMLMMNGKFYCGASLINNLYAITAAHCIKNFVTRTITVRLLAHDRLSADSETIDRKIAKVILNRFNMVTFSNDIALIKLNEAVKMSENLRPVCLPTGPESFTGQTGIVTGWGTLVEMGRPADVLQQVSVTILSNDECREKYREVTESMMCAGEAAGGKDACQGDSGGPLHVVQGIKYIQAGIVSWGDGCAEPGKPGVYTKVGNYYDWIQSNTEDACYCN